jgi:hypothetical protein
MHDVASQMATRGWHVVVITSDRGYEEPNQRFSNYQELDGVHILRVPFSSFGKGSIATRLAGGGIFVSEATLVASTLLRVDRVLVSTSPPMCPLAGIALSRLKRAPLVFWTMDINPDQIVATGTLSPHALPVRAFDWMNRQTLAHAARVIVLDEFMAERLQSKFDVRNKLSVVRLWPQVDPTLPVLHHSENTFRSEHQLGEARVLMYSGNLSPVHPITTCLDAAVALRDEPRLMFVFVGGGLGRKVIERYVTEHQLRNVRIVSYQPLSQLRVSLAAADLHLVSMGAAMVGIVHPSKIYSAMAVGRPVFALGPRDSHVGDLVERHRIGWRVDHDDTVGAVTALTDFLNASADDLAAMGMRARQAATLEFSKSRLLRDFCEQLEASTERVTT